jgi:hypothetical protein
VPFTVKRKAAAPAVALVCETEIFVGAGGDAGEIVKGSVFESTPELDTSIFTVPGEAINEAGMVAVSCVALTNVVARADGSAGGGFVAHSTTEPFTKFAPFTVTVTPGGLHAGVVFDEFVEDDKEAIVGALIVKGNCEEAGVPGLISSRRVVPGFARSAGGTVATSSIGFPEGVCAAVGSVVVTLLPSTH